MTQGLDIAKAVRVVITGDFEDAAAAFNKSPTGDAWARLQTAMWARQGISSQDSMEKMVKVANDTGVGHWTATMREIHEGKAK